MGEITFEIVKEISSLKDTWTKFDTLAAKEIADGKIPKINYTFYQTYTWNEFVDRYYSDKISVKLGFKHIEYVIVRQNGELKAILPLMVSSKRVEMTSWRTSGVNNVVMPFPDDSGKEICEKLSSFLYYNYKDKTIRLFDIPSGCDFAHALSALPNAKYSERGSYHIPLSDFNDFDEYYASLNKKLRHNIKTRSNHFTHGDLTCELKIFTRKNPPSDEYWKKVWQIFYLRKNVWRKRDINILRKLVCVWEVHNEIASGLRMASFNNLDETTLFVFEINGEPAAFAFLYLYDNYILVPKLAIDTAQRAHAPGILMLKEIMKWCYEHGVKDFDLCRGEEPYKEQMGAICEPVSRIVIKPHN